MVRIARRTMIRSNKIKCLTACGVVSAFLYGGYNYLQPDSPITADLVVDTSKVLKNLTEAYRRPPDKTTQTTETTEKSPIKNHQISKIQKATENPETTSGQVDVRDELEIRDELETVKVQGYNNGTFTVSAKFWEISSENTKNIFKTLPERYLDNLKNPCFWQEYEGPLNSDPYNNSPYAPEIGVTIKYDPWGHTNYYRRARERFAYHIRHQVIRNKIENVRLRCLPYFYLISTPKSGTTTLWNQMAKNPDVRLRIGIKENAWWNFMRNGINGDHHWVYHLVNPPPRYIPNDEHLETIDQFMDLFDNEAMDFIDISKENPYVNDITALAPINLLTAPMDFWDILYPDLVQSGFDAPPLILHPAYIISKVQPNAKFVALLRNPTDRLYSDWEFFNKQHDKQAFHELVVKAVEDFQDCVKEFNERKCLYDWKLIARSLRLNRGLYAPFLEDLFQIFPRKNVLVLPFEYYTTSQLEATNKILNFLNLTQIEDENQILKKAYYNRWFISEEDRIMLNATRKILDDFYGPFNRRLAKLMDNDWFLFNN